MPILPGGDSVHSKLLRLVEELRQCTPKWKSDGAIGDSEEKYLQNRVGRFEYDKGLRLIEMEPLVEERARPALLDPERIESDIRQEPLYATVLDALARRVPDRTSLLGQQLTWFLLSILVRTLRASDVDRLSFVDAVAQFVAHTQDQPTPWKVTCWVKGIWLPDDAPVNLSEAVSVRRPERSDFEVETPVEPWIYGWPGTHPAVSTPPLDVSAVVTITTHLCETEVDEQKNALLSLLRLLGLGSVASFRHDVQACEGLSFQGPRRHLPIHRPVVVYSYPLTSDSVAIFSSLESSVWDELLSVHDRPSRTDLSPDPASVALSRYEQALGERHVQARITAAITALEAILLRDTERSELSHRLAQRLATLLYALAPSVHKKPLKVYQQLSSAYDVRSAYIHGSCAAPEGDPTSLARVVVDYARWAVVAFLQRRGPEGKKKLLDLLDRAMLEAKARNGLNAMAETIVCPLPDGE